MQPSHPENVLYCWCIILVAVVIIAGKTTIPCRKRNDGSRAGVPEKTVIMQVLIIGVLYSFYPPAVVESMQGASLFVWQASCTQMPLLPIPVHLRHSPHHPILYPIP